MHRARARKAQWQILMFVLVMSTYGAAQTSDMSSEDRPAHLVLVSIPDRELAVISDGEVVATFPVAVGAADSPSPAGEFRIVSRVTNPTYYRPGTVIPSGKDNPVGTRWIGLSQKGYGIHGTNAPRSIGRAASHGCIRLRNRDVEQLFSMLRVGDVVQIRAERDQQVAEVFGNADDDSSTGQVSDEEASIPSNPGDSSAEAIGTQF